MANPLAGYGAGIRKETLLGWVAWYGISEAEVKYDDLKAKFEELDLDLEALPAEIRAIDAFKRACRYTQANKVPINGSDRYANVMVRDVAADKETTERHMVVEIVDAEGRRLEYEVAARLIFTKKVYEVFWDDEKGKPQSQKFYLHHDAHEFMEGSEGDNVRMSSMERAEVTVDKIWSAGAHNDIVDRAIADFHRQFERALQYLDTQTLRQMVRRQLDYMKSFMLRRNGSVYFLPKTEEKRAVALCDLLDWIGEGSVFHILPLIDTDKQREMIQGAFEDEVHEEAMQMIHQLQENLKSGKTITAAAWATFRERKDELIDRSKVYSDLIDREFAKAGTELAVLDDTMSEMLNLGLVKP